MGSEINGVVSILYKHNVPILDAKVTYGGTSLFVGGVSNEAYKELFNLPEVLTIGPPTQFEPSRSSGSVSDC